MYLLTYSPYAIIKYFAKFQVCLHDIVVVNVENRIPDQNVAIHWRGQAQASSPLMDGVPMVTQCPTPSFTTFQYKFRASNVGTHTWHLYNGENGKYSIEFF